jgi:hypothetical protein
MVAVGEERRVLEYGVGDGNEDVRLWKDESGAGGDDGESDEENGAILGAGSGGLYRLSREGIAGWRPCRMWYR